MTIEHHECMIATTWNHNTMQEVKDWVAALSEKEQSLFAFIPSRVNDRETLIMVLDGNKNGWETSKQSEALRNRLIELIETFDYEDGSNPFDWVEVGYGELGQKVLRGNCKNLHGLKPDTT